MNSSNELDLREIVKDFWNVKYRFLIIAFCIFSILASVLYLNTSFNVSNSSVSMPLLTADEDFDINYSALINKSNVQSVLEELNVAYTYEDIEKNITFSSGERNINNFIEEVNAASTETLLRIFGKDLSVLNNITNELYNLRNRYKTINFDITNLEIDKIKAKLIVEKLVTAINADLKNRHNLSALEMIPKTNASQKLTPETVYILYKKREQINETFIVIQRDFKEYSSLPKFVNLKIRMLLKNNDLRKLLSFYPFITKSLDSEIGRNRKNIEEKIIIIDELLLAINDQVQPTITGIQTSSSNFNIQKDLGIDLLNKFITMDEKLSLNDLRKDLISEKKLFAFSLADINKSFFADEALGEIIVDEDRDELFIKIINSFIAIETEINEIIFNIKELKNPKNYLEPMSGPVDYETNIIDTELKIKILLLLIISFAISGSILLMRFLLKNE